MSEFETNHFGRNGDKISIRRLTAVLGLIGAMAVLGTPLVRIAFRTEAHAEKIAAVEQRLHMTSIKVDETREVLIRIDARLESIERHLGIDRPRYDRTK